MGQILSMRARRRCHYVRLFVQVLQRLALLRTCRVTEECAIRRSRVVGSIRSAVLPQRSMCMGNRAV